MHCNYLMLKRLWTAGARSKSKANVSLQQQLDISDTKLTLILFSVITINRQMSTNNVTNPKFCNLKLNNQRAVDKETVGPYPTVSNYFCVDHFYLLYHMTIFLNLFFFLLKNPGLINSQTFSCMILNIFLYVSLCLSEDITVR